MAALFSIAGSLTQICDKQWDALSQHVFTRHAFLLGLEQEKCASAETGWGINYLLMHEGSTLVGAVPLYLKSHSQGEYVFDHNWAHAYQQHGLAYYPKLVATIPFTPVSGPRLLSVCPAGRQKLALALKRLALKHNIASLHVLFPEEQDRQALEQAGFMVRVNIQFHWLNQGYASIDDFLATLTRDKRKKMRQDSRKVQEAGIKFLHLRGWQIRPEDLAFFFQCYTHTYISRGQSPYLSLSFFERWLKHDPEALVLIMAQKDGKPQACALCVQDGDRLYGRYWGCQEFTPGLHFETCYTQAIAYCISHGLQHFEGGAQGEHKLSRGLMPVKTYSAHWIEHPQFASAIQDYLDRETDVILDYADTLTQSGPFKVVP